MDLIKAEIARKKELLAQKKVVNVEQGKKYFKRGELQEAERRDYLQSHGMLRTVPDTKSSTPSSTSAPVSTTDVIGLDDIAALPHAEVIRRLRRRGEPIVLFGEDAAAVRRRLHELEITDPENEAERQRNDFQDAMANVNEEVIEELLAKRAEEEGGEGESASAGKIHTLKYKWADFHDFMKDLRKDEKTDMKLVRRFFQFLLDLWEHDLSLRSEEEKLSTEGKNASAIHKQTESYLKPLFKKLKSGEVLPDVLTFLREILTLLLQREYMQANDKYVRLAIGNAAWPIGVTNVGIHSRTGREKIFSQNIAHVLNDEEQRKYIQAIKRLMTFCQQRFPSDPSKCLEYGGLVSAQYPRVRDDDDTASTTSNHSHHSH